MTEADTCRKFVVPLLQAAGWDNDPHSIAEQRCFTAGRIVSQGPRNKPARSARPPSPTAPSLRAQNLRDR